MRGQTSPTPIYEGEDGVVAWLLDGPDAAYDVAAARPRRGQAGDPRHVHEGALGGVPVAGAHRPGAPAAPRRAPSWSDPARVASIVIHTSHHTHYVIGSGANDPQKYDPTASRETLDHSIPYIFAVALQDGAWHHVASYAPERAARPDTVELWRKITTAEDAGWTAPLPLDATRPRRRSADGSRSRSPTARGSSRRSPSPTPTRSARGRSRASSTWRSSAPWPTASCARAEIERFLDVAQRLPDLTADELGGLTVVAPAGLLDSVTSPGGDSSDALRHDHPGREARRPCARRSRRRRAAAASRGRSTRCPRGSSRTRASTASTSPAPCCPPTSGCPTSA